MSGSSQIFTFGVKIGNKNVNIINEKLVFEYI